MKKVPAIVTLIIASMLFAFPVSSGATVFQDKPLKINKKEPVGGLGGRCRNIGDSLSVILSVEFLDTGKIGRVSITKASGCEYFDNRALTVARKIQFTPQVRAGKPVTTTRRVDYYVNVH